MRREEEGVHGFKLYNDGIGKAIDESILTLAEVGSLEMGASHGGNRTPKKTSNHRLNEWEKAYDRRLARKRAVAGHIHAKIKTFKITAYPYRNHRKRHSLRMTLICGIVNFELCI
jgi:hypothetical protein